MMGFVCAAWVAKSRIADALAAYWRCCRSMTNAIEFGGKEMSVQRVFYRRCEKMQSCGLGAVFLFVVVGSRGDG